MPETPDVDATVRKLEALLEEIGAADPQLRERSEEAIRLLMQLYGCGFARVVEIAGGEVASRLGEDKLVSSLLLLHGLHPVDAATRIREALQRVERRLGNQRLVLTGISENVAQIRVDSDGRAPVPSGLAAMIERAVADCAPDIAGLEIEGLPQPAITLVQIAPAASQ